MWKAIGKLVGGVIVAITVLGIVFMVGMRSKSPLVLNAVRRAGRAARPLAMRSSGTPGASASVVRHAGRKTGRSYETPVSAVPTDDGFVIALPYGLNTDWLKNVLASGSATILDEGITYDVDRPEIVPLSVAEPLFPPKDQRTHRRFRIDEYLLVRRVASDDAVRPG